MTFLRVEMLLIIWAVPVLLTVFIYGMRRRRHILARFASKKGLQTIAADADPRRRWIKAGLMLCVILLTTLALAGPQYGYKWQEIERRGIDLIIALDCSKSMLAADIKPTRLDRAKREVFDLLHLLQGDRAGLVVFAGSAFLQCPLTLDYEAFNLFLNALSPDLLPVGGTNLSEALRAALAGFDQTGNSEKAVILITDGENTSGDPEEASEALAAAGVRLFCIGVGKGQGVPVPDETGGLRKAPSGNIILTRLDEATLKKIAHKTGGRYVRSVAGDMDLDMIYTEEIRGKMEATTLAGGRKQVWQDRYQWFLGLALLTLIAEIFTPALKKKVMVLTAIMILQGSPGGHAGEATQTYRNGLEAYEKEDYAAALKLFIDSQLEHPDRPEIYYNIGNTYYRLGQYDSALNNYSAALQGSNEVLRQKANYNLGNTNFRKGLFQEALQHYQTALEMDPEDRQARQNYEFTRKMMQQQKQQQDPSESPENSDDSKNDADSRQPQDESRQSQQDTDREKGAQDRTAKDAENTREKPDKAPQADKDKQMNTDQDPGAVPPGRQEQAGGMGRDSAGSEPGAPPEKIQQAERILNRLHDKPGGAMFPMYQKRQVEKDW